MSEQITEPQLLKEVIKREPIYNMKMDARLRQKCWENLTDMLAPHGYDAAQKKDLEIGLRRRWSTLNGFFMYYFKKLYDLVDEIVSRYSPSFGDKISIFRHMCTKISNLMKFFLLDEDEFDHFQRCFEFNRTDPDFIENRFKASENARRYTGSVQTQTELSHLNVPPERARIDSFLAEITNELIKLPEEASLRMQNEIRKLFRPNPSIEAEQRQSTINLINQLDNNISFQYNLLNTQLEFLSQIKQHLDLRAPQPAPCCLVPPPPQQNPNMAFVRGNPMNQPNMVPCMNCPNFHPQNMPPNACPVHYGPPVMAPHMNMPHPERPNYVEQTNQPNNTEANDEESDDNEDNDAQQNDVDMPDQFEQQSNDEPEFPDAVQDFLDQTSPVTYRLAVRNLLRRYFRRPRTRAGNNFNPFLQRNEFGTVVHKCDELVLSYANDILYSITSNTSPSRDLDFEPYFGPSTSGIRSNRKRNASEIAGNLEDVLSDALPRDSPRNDLSLNLIESPDSVDCGLKNLGDQAPGPSTSKD